MRFDVSSEIVQYMIKPLAKISLLFLLHLETTQLFQQHGGGFLLNKVLKENSLEYPLVLNGVDRKDVVPYKCFAMQRTWKHSTCNIIVMYLECL